MAGEEKSLQEMLLELGRRIIGREALLLLGFAVSVGGGTLYVTRAWADEAQQKVDAGVAPLARELDAVKEQLAEQRRYNERTEARIRSVEISALETSQNVTLLVRAAGMKPISLPRPPPVDGGEPP